MSTPLKPNDLKEKKERKMVIFDFDETIVNTHFHKLISTAESKNARNFANKDIEDFLEQILNDPNKGIKGKNNGELLKKSSNIY